MSHSKIIMPSFRSDFASGTSDETAATTFEQLCEYADMLERAYEAERAAKEEAIGVANVATEMWKSAERDAFRACEKTPKARACCVSQPFRDQWCGACRDAWDALHEA